MSGTPDPDRPQPDCLEGAPHPNATLRLYGQSAPEAAFLSAFNAGRLQHGWLITGPRGIGKATLAWRIARFLLATPQDDGGMFAPAPPPTASISPKITPSPAACVPDPSRASSSCAAPMTKNPPA